jgi:hypothetical protein
MSILDKAQISVICRRCEFENQVLIERIIAEKTIICRGCRSSISLVDHLKSVQKTEKDLTEALNNIRETLKKAFNFEIKL